MDIDQLLTTTRSARKALDLAAPVALDEIRECLQIALHAPNGSNQQAWRWMVVTAPSLRAQIAKIYRQTYLKKVGGQLVAGLMPSGTAEAKLMSLTEFLVENLHRVPVFVIPCYEPSYPRTDGDESFYLATLYGSIFPAAWNFHLALHSRGYGTCITTMHLEYEREVGELLGIPATFVQGCLLPVAKLRPRHVVAPTPRRDLEEVIAVNEWSSE